MTYSMDLRKRVVSAVEHGQTITQVARRFTIARPTVRDWRDRAGQGRLSPGVPGPKGPTKLTASDDRLIQQHIAAQPGITAKQLAGLLSVRVSLQTVYRHLQKLGLSLPSVTGPMSSSAARTSRLPGGSPTRHHSFSSMNPVLKRT